MLIQALDCLQKLPHTTNLNILWNSHKHVIIWQKMGHGLPWKNIKNSYYLTTWAYHKLFLEFMGNKMFCVHLKTVAQNVVPTLDLCCIDHLPLTWYDLLYIYFKLLLMFYMSKWFIKLYIKHFSSFNENNSNLWKRVFYVKAILKWGDYSFGGNAKSGSDQNVFIWSTLLWNIRVYFIFAISDDYSVMLILWKLSSYAFCWLR